MRGRNNRLYRDGCAHHVFLKALEGNVLFYRTEDYVFFLTLLYYTARRYGIGIEAVCIMFNHVHIFVKMTDSRRFKAFLNDLQHRFAMVYNKEYSLSGSLMMHAGFAPKGSRKSILSCLIYIVNNPVAGNLTSNALGYKWNLLAYFGNSNPFSERLVKRECRFRMRRALKMVDYYSAHGKYLDYNLQERILDGLTKSEKAQIVDYIICKYNPVDYGSLISRFGSIESLVIAAESTTGTEYDLPEPWEDYSIYTKMLRITQRSGIDHHGFHFNWMDKDDYLRLGKVLTVIPRMTPDHLHRFLRLPVNHPQKYSRDL